MSSNKPNGSRYHRYHIEVENTADIQKWPTRFNVKVGKIGLAKHLIGELIHTRGNMPVVTSRPCMYGVFSGPVGGFAPRPQHCVGCLRCSTEFPDFVRVSHNPDRRKLGDDYFTFDVVNAVTYEAETGLVPVKGAGYRGKFGGEGWDGMWTDMSEIVRPTRDGIHGREYISTVVDIGSRPNFLVFDTQGQSVGKSPHTIQIELPILFDAPPASLASDTFWKITAQTADEIQSLAVLPLNVILRHGLEGDHVVPLVKPDDEDDLALLRRSPQLLEMDRWDKPLFTNLKNLFPDALICLRIPFPSKDILLEYYMEGIRVFHLLADFHGRDREGHFILDLIRRAHKTFVDAGLRQEVTLLGSGGMIAAEHIPKGILCGLDAVAIDTAALVALQARFESQCADRETSQFILPSKLTVPWGVQRLKNLTASWRDQMLEILGAMGLREVRRLRGEMGRAMFAADLEEAAFAGISAYGI
ncbi:MAG: glutamate synthase-related protein [Anaerolineales bacterium]|jgi:hypothetical protein